MCLVTQSCPTFCDPMDCSPPGSSLPWGFSRQEHWSGWPCPSPGDLPNPGIKSRSPALQADSLSAEPQGKPKNTGVGSLSLLQRIFPTQESNWALLHCRQILYQLSYEESPSWEICMQVKKQQLEPGMEQRLVPNWERSMPRLYIVTLLI